MTILEKILYLADYVEPNRCFDGVDGIRSLCYEDLDAAMERARKVAAPINKQRFPNSPTPCLLTGACANCKGEGSICNQILITRSCRPFGRIKFVIVGEELGF